MIYSFNEFENRIKNYFTKLLYKKKIKQGNNTNQDKVKIQFFANVSHETKTPLTLISNYLNRYMEKTGTTEELAVIKQNIEKLQRDMVNFLDSEKLQRGQVFYKHNQIIDFSVLVKQKITMFRDMADKKKIKIKPDIHKDIYIKADPFAIDRVINNLFDNAIKYTNQNGQIKIRLAAGNSRIHFIVMDSGIGISREHRQFIFKPYHQISHEKRNLQGIGMGLFIVYKIVETLNGKIMVRSKLNQGSAFMVSLPEYMMKPGEKADHDIKFSKPINTAPVVTELKEGKKDSSLYTLFVVEDNINLLHFLQSSLSKRFNVYAAINGHKALEKIKEIPRPDVIISDIMMDGMDGLMLCETLSRDEQYEDIPFIFITAKTSVEDRVKGLSKGAVDYISKPFTIEELNAKIDAIIRFTAINRRLFEMDKFASIGKLVAGISHEIFNPLSGIRGPLQFLDSRIKELEQHATQESTRELEQALLFIYSGMDRIESIIKSLKILYYNSSVSVCDVKVKKIVDSILLLLPKSTGKGPQIIVKIPVNFTVDANHGALTRILMNLIGNALDATQDNGTITVKAQKQGSVSVIKVIDTGTGIEKERLDRIFDIFYTTKESGKGTGLGLYIVKDLAAKMGWRVTVKSSPGKGSTFSLYSSKELDKK